MTDFTLAGWANKFQGSLRGTESAIDSFRLTLKLNFHFASIKVNQNCYNENHLLPSAKTLNN